MKNDKIKDTESNLGIKIIVGGIFLVFGIAMLKIYVGIVFLFLSIVAFTYSTGIEINYAEHAIRPYTRFLWLVSGKWIKLNNYNSMVIRKTRKGMRQYGGRTNVSTSRFFTFYDVYLLSDKYHHSVLLFSSKDQHKSVSFAEKWSEKLDVPVAPK